MEKQILEAIAKFQAFKFRDPKFLLICPKEMFLLHGELTGSLASYFKPENKLVEFHGMKVKVTNILKNDDKFLIL